MTSVPKARATRRMQYAALPYRQRQDGEVQIRLITSRETRRWVIPKGWPMKGISPAKAAAREAYEEAGLLGNISSEALGIYSYDKRLALKTVPCDVMVFPLKVKRYLKTWPERSERFGFWFSIESAAAAVQEPDLGQLILDFGAMMAERFARKRSRAPQPAAKASAAAGAESGAALSAAMAAGQEEPVAPSSKRRKAVAGKAAGEIAGKPAKAKVADPAAPAKPSKSAKAAKASKPPEAVKGKTKGQRAVPLAKPDAAPEGWSAQEAPVLPSGIQVPPTRH